MKLIVAVYIAYGEVPELIGLQAVFLRLFQPAIHQATTS
jgi:hypothetical protein